MPHDLDTDELLGIVRCDRCGQRLEGEIECPVCSGYYDDGVKRSGGIPLWIFIIAAFLTSPLSIPFIIRSARLTVVQKVLCASGAFGWALLGFSFLF